MKDLLNSDNFKGLTVSVNLLEMLPVTETLVCSPTLRKWVRISKKYSEGIDRISNFMISFIKVKSALLIQILLPLSYPNCFAYIQEFM